MQFLSYAQPYAAAPVIVMFVNFIVLAAGALFEVPLKTLKYHDA